MIIAVDFDGTLCRGAYPGIDGPQPYAVEIMKRLVMYQLAMTLLERNKYGDLDLKSISKLYEMEERFGSDAYTSIMKLFRESNIVDGTAINYYFSRKDQMGVWRRLEPSFNRL